MLRLGVERPSSRGPVVEERSSGECYADGEVGFSAELGQGYVGAARWAGATQMRIQNQAASLASLQVRAVFGTSLAIKQKKREWPGEVMTVGSTAHANGRMR